MSGVKSGSRKKVGGSARKTRAGRQESSSSSSSSSAAAAAAAASAPPQDFASLIESVEEMLEQSDLSTAERALRSPALLGKLRAADIGPAHAELVPAMELLAQVLMEKGKTKEAFTWLRASCMLQPDGGSEKWMYYGQLIGGEPALDAFKRGITCMLKQKQNIHDKIAASRQRALANAFTLGEHETDAALAQQLVAVDKQISSGYTSMAELYVTDCCDMPNAEQECEKLLTLALAACPDNPDALYASANLRTIQQRIPEATELIVRCLAVLQACRARSIEQMGVLSLGAPDQTHLDDDVPASISLYDVSYELRVAVAKLALELEQYPSTAALLDQLLEEDDRVLEVEHLAAVAQYNCGDYRTALAHCDAALQLLASEESSAEDLGMAGGGGEDDGEEESADPQQQAREQEEIEASKRALQQLRAQCAEGAKTQPADPEDAEDEAAEAAAEAEDDGEDNEEELLMPAGFEQHMQQQQQQRQQQHRGAGAGGMQDEAAGSMEDE